MRTKTQEQPVKVNNVKCWKEKNKITERKRSKKERNCLQQQLLEVMRSITGSINVDYETLCDNILIKMIALTQSQYGFYGFLSEDESIMTLYIWPTEALKKREMQDKSIEYPIAKAGFWGDVVRKRKRLIVNDYQAYYSSKKVLPDSHMSINRLLVVPIFNHKRIIAVAAVANKTTDYTCEDAEQINAFVTVAQAILEQKLREEKLNKSREQLEGALEGIIRVLASVTDLRDPHAAGHQQRVSKLACTIAQWMDLSDNEINGIHLAGLIHDLGKIRVPAEILSKPGKLTIAEFDTIKSHPRAGYDILKKIELPWPVAQIVLQHHERLDGSGYPSAISGEDILLGARILAVADVLEAMVSHRPYRPAREIEEALEEILEKRGILYDPEVVDICVKLFNEKIFKF